MQKPGCRFAPSGLRSLAKHANGRGHAHDHRLALAHPCACAETPSKPITLLRNRESCPDGPVLEPVAVVLGVSGALLRRYILWLCCEKCRMPASEGTVSQP